uniref:GK21340 n=2 Tax=Drosophila willistoni TaxID=7260 RepID=B4MR20_DROWI
MTAEITERQMPAASVKLAETGGMIAPPPSRQRTLTRTPEMDADCDDAVVIDVNCVESAVETDVEAETEAEASADDAADSITLELALSPHSTTPSPSPSTLMMMPDDEVVEHMNTSKPFKVKDITRNIRKAVVATTLEELRLKVSAKFQRTQPAIHLDCDGTEIDDEEYFNTLEPNAELIAVFPGEQWLDPSDYNANLRRTSLDAQRLRKLVSKLQPNYINDDDLDKLSNMDPNSLVDITGREPKDNEYYARSTELSC